MFGLLKKRKETAYESIASPVKGTVVEIGQVPDPMFAQEILGKGVAIEPEDGNIYAPVDGKISALIHTNHAFSILTQGGAEVLVHLGIDTVKLEGKYFISYIKVGDEVKKGDLLVKAEIDKVKEAGYAMITPLLVCNMADDQEIKVFLKGKVRAGDEVLRLL